MNNLDITVRVLTDKLGAVEARKVVEQIKQETVKADVAMADSIGEVEKKTGFLNLRKAELKKLIRELSHEFPIAGAAARLFINPTVAGISLLIGAFALMKRHLDDWNKALDEAAARAAQRELLPGFEAAVEALRQGKIEAAGFDRALGQAGQGRRLFADDLDKIVSKLHELQTARAEMIDSELAVKLSRINLAEKIGQLSPAQADIARYQAQNESAKRQEDNRRAAEAAEINARQQTFDRAVMDQRGLESAAVSAGSTATQTKSRIERLKANKAAFEERIKDSKSERDLRDEVARAQESVDAAQNIPGGIFGNNYDRDVEVAKRIKKLDEAKANLQELLNRQRFVRKAQEEITALEIQYDAQKDAAKEAESAALKNKTFVEQQRGQLPEMRSDIARRQSVRATVNANAQEVRSNELRGDIFSAAEAAQKQHAEETVRRVSQIIQTSGNGATSAVVQIGDEMKKQLNAIADAVLNQKTQLKNLASQRRSDIH